MNKTQKLEELFKAWLTKQCKDELFFDHDTKIGTRALNGEHIKKCFFQKDGIVCEEEYDVQPIKVLFITNEPNMSEDSANNYALLPQPDSRANFTKFYEDNEDFDGKLQGRMCALYQTLIGNEVENPNTVAKKFAFMNINKRGGAGKIKGAAGLKNIVLYWNTYYDEIANEINIISPDVILWCGCGTFDKIVSKKRNQYTKDFIIIGGNDKHYIYQINNEINEPLKLVPVIRLYHTSTQHGDEKRYNQLKLICSKFEEALLDPATNPEYRDDINLNNLIKTWCPKTL